MPTFFDLPFDSEPSPGDPPSPPERREARVEPDDTGAGAPAATSRRRTYTVSELTSQIRGLIEGEFYDVWVAGEISNHKQWTTGHVYFTLKDESAQLKSVMYRTAVRRLRFAVEDGMRVIARGRLSVYEPKGEYQFICETLEPQGRGALQIAFEQLKKKLAGEGLFADARKRPLPALPRKIGVITSLDGAAVRDILKVLDRRYGHAHVVIRPVRVQGDGAAGDIARALTTLPRVTGVDVIIVARGGGSIEDLWAFNEEIVARAIARTPVPVISGVGHQSDFTIADFVADVRAATPSNAAELVVARRADFVAGIDRLAERLRSRLARVVSARRLHLQRLDGRPVFSGFAGRLALRSRHVAELTSDMTAATVARVSQGGRVVARFERRLDAAHPRRRLAAHATRLARLDGRLTASARAEQHRYERALGALAGRLGNLSPLAVLARGYAVCWNTDRTSIVRDAQQTTPGERVVVTLSRGELSCEVVERLVDDTVDGWRRAVAPPGEE